MNRNLWAPEKEQFLVFITFWPHKPYGYIFLVGPDHDRHSHTCHFFLGHVCERLSVMKVIKTEGNCTHTTPNTLMTIGHGVVCGSFLLLFFWGSCVLCPETKDTCFLIPQKKRHLGPLNTCSLVGHLLQYIMADLEHVFQTHVFNHLNVSLGGQGGRNFPSSRSGALSLIFLSILAPDRHVFL